jgi:hypothetical protein
MQRHLCCTCFAGLLFTFPGSAQWVHQPDPRTPRTRDGKPNLSASAPRRDGKPDLSGVWEVESTPREVLASLFPPGVGLLPGGENGLGEDDPSKYFMNILADYKPAEEPLTPKAKAKLQKLFESAPRPMTLCEPSGLPTSEFLPAPFKMLQTRGELLMLYEADTVFRQIFMDGRKLPPDPQPSWFGYSVGHWEGDILVVEVSGITDRSALDAMGHFHSQALRLSERFRRPDFGHMQATITLEDPEVLVKPVSIHVNYRLLPDTDLIESFCTEGEQDLAHLRSK